MHTCDTCILDEAATLCRKTPLNHHLCLTRKERSPFEPKQWLIRVNLNVHLETVIPVYTDRAPTGS